jgi:hypothetical protein
VELKKRNLEEALSKLPPSRDNNKKRGMGQETLPQSPTFSSKYFMD